MMELVRVCGTWDSRMLGAVATGVDPIWYSIKQLQAPEVKDSKLALCKGSPIFCDGEALVPRRDLIMMLDAKALKELECKPGVVVQ
jgi:hypothetical protein